MIASGSIGQVYKVHNKNGDIFALKIIHPNIQYQIFFVEYLIKLLYSIKPLRDYFEYHLPFSLINFILDFKTQINLIAEANNCLRFYKEYESNDIIIIPEVHRVSKNILIMSYEEGEKIDEINCSNYIKSQSLLLLKLFIKNNQYYFLFMHGDLHKGNWKMRKNGSIVIYDFGFCWNIPKSMNESFKHIDKAFLDVDNEEKVIDGFSYACYLFIGKKVCLNIIKKETNLLSKVFDLIDPVFLIKLTINITKNHHILLDSYVLQSLILHNQLHKNFVKYNVTIGIDESKGGGYISNKYYNKQIHDIICFCETKKIFNQYKNDLEKEYESKGIVKKNIFQLTSSFDEYPNLKGLAIN